MFLALFVVVGLVLLCETVRVKPLGTDAWLSSKLCISSPSAVDDTCSGDGVARPSWLGGVCAMVLPVWQPLMSEQFREFREQSLK